MDAPASRSRSKRPLRAGGTALTALSASLNLEVLRCLAEGAQPLQELSRVLGFPPRSTMRLYLEALVEMGAIERRTKNANPSSAGFEITRAGRALLGVGDVVQRWLSRAPAGPIELGSTAAKSAIKALVEGWGSNIVRALATRPLSLTQLDRLIPRISYPSLERRLTAMRQVGLLEAHRVPGRLNPNEVTRWLREAVTPVIAAASWERRYAPDRTPDLRRLDVEAAFLLAIPLVELAPGLGGRCRLSVEVTDGTGPLLAGVLLDVERGVVTSCIPSLEGEAEAWAYGRPRAWLDRLSGSHSGDELELGGKKTLAEATIEALSHTMDGPH
jgi:DNA-binding HxlR family transcriptional regulator